MKEKYYLHGQIFVKSWYDCIGYSLLEIETDKKGLEKIEKEPLQDFLNYGTKEVIYVYFEVYKSIYKEVKKNNITYCGYLTSNESIKTIEAGEPPNVDIDFDNIDIVKIEY